MIENYCLKVVFTQAIKNMAFLKDTRFSIEIGSLSKNSMPRSPVQKNLELL
jgi:hypothetical protein